MDRSAEVVRQDHIQEAMRVKLCARVLVALLWLLLQGFVSLRKGPNRKESDKSNVTPPKEVNSLLKEQLFKG